jgi:predicted RNase H-like HicB family nuclease
MSAVIGAAGREEFLYDIKGGSLRSPPAARLRAAASCRPRRPAHAVRAGPSDRKRSQARRADLSGRVRLAPPREPVKGTASRLAALGPAGLSLTAAAGSADRLGKRAAPEPRGRPRRLPYPAHLTDVREVEFVFEPQDEGGYHVYAPDLPGLHTQGETLEEATENAREALELYVEGLRQAGRPIGTSVVRRKLPVPA